MAKKSQAALEFLTTYGWAFVIVLASIGALVYFGVLDPSIFIPERCILGTDFVCKDYQLSKVYGLATVEFIMINSMGEIIDINEINVTFPDESSALCMVSPDYSDPAVENWISGTNLTFKCTNTGPASFVGGDKAKVLVDIEYRLNTGGFPHTQEGEIYSTVFES